MTGESRSYSLDISEHLFYLTTESLRLHCNETKRYQTLAGLLNDKIFASSSIDEQAPETIREHLSAIPTKGNIRVYLNITRSSADNLTEVKRRLATSLGSNLTVGDTLSIMLFHYVVGQKVTRILKQLGLDDSTSQALSAAEHTEHDVAQHIRLVVENGYVSGR